jgi:K+-sensing histidine kinase KdpD
VRNLFSRSKDTIAATLQTSRAWISSVVDSVSEALETGWAKLAASAGVVAASTLALLEIDRYFGVPYLVFGYILPVLLIGIRFGRTTTLSTAMLSCLCAGFFFVEPQAVLDAVGGNELTIWLSFCAVALLASQLPIKKILRGLPPSDLLRVRSDQSKQLPK